MPQPFPPNLLSRCSPLQPADACGLTLLLLVTLLPSSPEGHGFCHTVPRVLSRYPHASHFFCPCPGHHLRPRDSSGPSMVPDSLVKWKGCRGLPWWLSGKEPGCQCRRLGFDPWVGRFRWWRKWQPTPVFLPGKSHGQRSPAGYSPRSHKESDTTK